MKNVDIASSIRAKMSIEDYKKKGFPEINALWYLKQYVKIKTFLK